MWFMWLGSCSTALIWGGVIFGAVAFLILVFNVLSLGCFSLLSIHYQVAQGLGIQPIFGVCIGLACCGVSTILFACFFAVIGFKQC